jgi:hypothetical protein
MLLGLLCMALASSSAHGFRLAVSSPHEPWSRRDVMATSMGWISSGLWIQSNTLPSAAAATTSAEAMTPSDVERIQTGYRQINYLLDNFEQETTVCRENGGECKRDANSIRKALGLRSTTDPLFQIEKVFAKFKNMDIDPEKLDALYDAAEDWNSATSMSNSMAFISQFGEYNPGGGKDEVLKYLIESKKQVLLAKDALQTIMTNLDIPTK